MSIDTMLAEIEARANSATPGPWTVEIEECEDHGCNCGEIHIPEIERAFHSCEWADAEDWDRDEANAEFCANAITDVPRLIAALRVAVGWIGTEQTCGSVTARTALEGIETTLRGE